MFRTFRPFLSLPKYRLPRSRTWQTGTTWGRPSRPAVATRITRSRATNLASRDVSRRRFISPPSCTGHACPPPAPSFYNFPCAAAAGRNFAPCRDIVESASPRHAAEVLADVGRLLSRTLDRHLVAQRLADSVRGQFDADLSVVYRFDADNQTLTAAATSGASGPVCRGTELAAGAGAVGLAIRLRQPVAVDDLLEDQRIALPHEFREWLLANPQPAALAAPLLVQDCVTGAVSLSAASPRRFGGMHARLLEAFAGLGALALENARLHEQALEVPGRRLTRASDAAHRHRRLGQCAAHPEREGRPGAASGRGAGTEHARATGDHRRAARRVADQHGPPAPGVEPGGPGPGRARGGPGCVD